MFSLSMTSMTCDLKDRYLARIQDKYFKVVFTFGKFSVKVDQHQSLIVEIKQSSVSLSLHHFLLYYLGFVILNSDVGPWVAMVNSLQP